MESRFYLLPTSTEFNCYIAYTFVRSKVMDLVQRQLEAEASLSTEEAWRCLRVFRFLTTNASPKNDQKAILKTDHAWPKCEFEIKSSKCNCEISDRAGLTQKSAGPLHRRPTPRPYTNFGGPDLERTHGVPHLKSNVMYCLRSLYL